MADETMQVRDGLGVVRGIAVDQMPNGDLVQVIALGHGADGTVPTRATPATPLPVDGAAPGAWSYKAGVSGAPSLAGLRILSIACVGGGSGGTVTINGGDSIAVGAGEGFELVPRARLVAPTVVFTGMSKYLIEAVGA